MLGAQADDACSSTDTLAAQAGYSLREGRRPVARDSGPLGDCRQAGRITADTLSPSAVFGLFGHVVWGDVWTLKAEGGGLESPRSFHQLQSLRQPQNFSESFPPPKGRIKLPWTARAMKSAHSASQLLWEEHVVWE